MPKRDFASETAALEKTMAGNRSDAVVRLRALNEAWARSLLGIEDSASLVPAVRAVVESEFELGDIGGWSQPILRELDAGVGRVERLGCRTRSSACGELLFRAADHVHCDRSDEDEHQD